MEPFRRLGITLKPMENHWISLCFLQSLRDGTPHGLSGILTVLGNLMVNRKRWKTIRFPYVFTCRIKGAPAELKVALGYSATEMKNSTLRLTGKRSKTIEFPYVFADLVKSSRSN